MEVYGIMVTIRSKGIMGTNPPVTIIIIVKRTLTQFLLYAWFSKSCHKFLALSLSCTHAPPMDLLHLRQRLQLPETLLVCGQSVL